MPRSRRGRIRRRNGDGPLVPPPTILPYQPPPPDDIPFDEGGVTPPPEGGGGIGGRGPGGRGGRNGGLGGGIVDPRDSRTWIAQRQLPQRLTSSAWQKWLESNRFRGRMKAPVINKDRRKSLLAVYPGPEARGIGGPGTQGRPRTDPKYGRPDYFPANDPRDAKRRLYGGR